MTYFQDLGFMSYVQGLWVRVMVMSQGQVYELSLGFISQGQGYEFVLGLRVYELGLGVMGQGYEFGVWL